MPAAIVLLMPGEGASNSASTRLLLTASPLESRAVLTPDSRSDVADRDRAAPRGRGRLPPLPEAEDGTAQGRGAR